MSGEWSVTTSDAAEQLLHRLRLLDAEVAEAVCPHERVVRDDRHPEPERAACDLLADPPEADDAERLPGDLDAAPTGALPPAVLERGVCLGDVPREREDQADRLLGRRDDRRLRRVRDDDPAARRGGDVHVVDPDPRAADHLQPVRPLDDALRETRRRPDHDPVVAVDDLLERRVGVDVDVEAAPEQLDACLGDRLADQDAVAHGFRPQAGATVPNASSAAGAALPCSTSAPAAASSTSMAVSAPAICSTDTWPIWPIRKSRGTRSP